MIMKKAFLSFVFLSVLGSLMAQNQLRVKAGGLYTYTSIAEYNRPGQSYYLLDSVDYDQQLFGMLAGLEVDIDLGKNVYFVSGFGYSRKGLPEISHTDFIGTTRSRTAFQNYLGIHFQFKYHHRFKDGNFGIYAATGPKVDFTIGGPNYAEFSTVSGSKFFQAFGSFNIAEFLWYTNFGFSYKLGPGDLVFDLNMMNGLSDALRDKYIIGKTLSIGVLVGYSFYLN